MNKSLPKEEVKQIVIERLKTLSPGKRISIGGEGQFTKEEMIDHVQKGDRIGQKIMAVQLFYLRSFKRGGPIED
jgi:hypothetical protein